MRGDKFMPAFTLRSFPPFVLLGALLAFALLNLISREPSAQALRFAGEMQQSSTQRAQSDAGGQAASPNPGDRGAGQEERVRQQLAKEYEQRFGASDEAIRNALGIRGKVADFVGYNARTTRWLIAE